MNKTVAEIRFHLSKVKKMFRPRGLLGSPVLLPRARYGFKVEVPGPSPRGLYKIETEPIDFIQAFASLHTKTYFASLVIKISNNKEFLLLGYKVM